MQKRSSRGQDSPLTTSRGKILDYLGMQINYCAKGRVTFSMEEYIHKLLNEVPFFDMDGVAKAPSTNYLFNVNDNARKLTEEKVWLFHHVVAKLLYLCRRTLPDIQMARVKRADEDDYKSWPELYKYIRDTRHMTLTIEPKPINDPQWWVNSLYAMHPDMIRHTGIFMSIGKGGTYTSSCNEKLNTKSSMEAELVAIDDAMAKIL